VIILPFFENEIGRPNGRLRRGAGWPSEAGGYGGACGQQKITAANWIGVGGHGSLPAQRSHICIATVIRPRIPTIPPRKV
jgi:hypothetical protein